MSEHDDTLLDEDLGDEEYDLGNDEEEALLADDYELERQNSYKGEEETDDVLDLGVTDALDDLDAEDENIEFSRGNTDKHSDNDFYKDGEHPEAQSTSSYYEQDENAEYANEHEALPQSSRNSESSSVNVSNIGKGDLREKLQKNMQKNMYGNGQGMEDDDCEEAKERRNRFQNERTMISPKMNNDIPDTLENVLTSEPSRMPFRGRGRSRGIRGSRGGRFIQNTGNFNPRFGTTRPGFENQPPTCRPPLIETRPPCGPLLGVPSNVPNQQMIFQQPNPQQPFQQPFGPNGPMQGPPAQFAENRPQFNPGQFQGPLGPRPIGSRLPEYGPRGPLPAGSMQGPNYNCPPNQPPYHAPMQQPFQNPPGIMQENRPMQGNQGPLLQGNPGGGSLLGNPPNMLLPGNPPNMLPPGANLPMPPIQGFPRQQPPQGPLIQNLPPNVQMPSQSPFENRLPPFQEPQFEGRSAYDARAGYHPDQVPNSQFNNTMPPVPQQSVSNVSHSVSLPPGHKILINPHFRGTVQPANDARLVWDSNQQVQPQASQGGQFPQPLSSYQNQGSYNNSQQGPSQYQQQNYQQNKSDDPYAYFSDVWQENRPQRPQNMSPSKHYPSDSNYSRESNYSDNKYKSEGIWDQRDNYQEDHRGSHQSYRERDLPLRIRNDHVQRSRTPPNIYRSDPYDQKTSRPVNVAPRGVNRLPQKRISESSDKGPREMSPKRSKPPNRNLQEVRRVDTVDEIVADKEEDNDPEMQEYRKKMEEQKRLREKLLREKENRRKMAAIEKQNEDAKTDSNIVAANSAENTQQETKPVSTLIGFVNDSAVKTRPGVTKGRNRPINTQNTEATDRLSNVRIIRTIQTNDLPDMSGPKSNSGHATNQASDIVQTRQVVQQPGVRRVVIQKPLINSQKIATTIQKTVSNLQKSQGLQQKMSNAQVVQTPKVLQNQGNALQKSPIVGSKAAVVNQRMVAHKMPGGLQKTVINDSANIHQKVTNAQQNPQRIVLQKSAVQAKKLPEIKTNTVKLENLAASTSEAQIRRMCQAIGTIESIRMGEGSATIVFKTQSAAMVFHKKYQRKMLDLSLITVRLVPQSAPGNKAITTVAKKS